MKINQGILDGEASVVVDRPTIEVIDVEVQHPVRSGALATDLGTVGVGIIMQPNGAPRILMDVRHPDDTALSIVLNGDALAELIAMLTDANAAAALAQRESLESTRQ